MVIQKRTKKKHHLYAIYDNEEEDIFKYGISDKPIRKDGTSKRMREQVNFLNRAVGWVRYIAKILIRGIPGKVKAREIEDQHVDTYREKHGRNPRGNANKTKKQRTKDT